MSPSVVVIIPVRRFSDGKSRLIDALDPDARRNLARNCAEGVLAAVGRRRRFVVCDDDEVEAWATGLGAEVLRVTTPGLNGSLTEAVPRIIDRCKPTHVAICHGDIPLTEGLDEIISEATSTAGCTIVTDTSGDGTNVLIGPSVDISTMGFGYGAGSAELHRVRLESRGSACRVVRHPRLSIDIDLPVDLSRPEIAPILRRLTTTQGVR